MQNVIINILGTIYTTIPNEFRPIIKRCVYWFIIRLKSVFLLRRFYKGTRVEFIDFEIANLESFEFLGTGKNEILFESKCSLISPGTERAVLCGLPGARRSFPYAPGYSAAGRIIKIGRNVKGFKVGDRVAGRVHHMSHQTLSPRNLFKISEGVSYNEACFIELGIITLQGIRKAGIKPGDRVAVVGQGMVGQLCNKLAHLVGSSSIIAVASSRNREKTAMLPGGATEYIALSENSVNLQEIQADIVIEAVGLPQAITTAMNCARNGGKVVLLGSSRGLGRGVNLWSLAQKKSLTIVGAHISALPEKDVSPGRLTYRQEGNLFLELLDTERLKVSDLITWCAAPGECNAVYELLALGGGEHIGIVFDWLAGSSE